MAKAAILVFLLGILFLSPAHADTTHWADTVTYVRAGVTHECILFQTTATGGVMGIDNSSTGNSGATGYTGNAQWNQVGVGTGTGSMTYNSGVVASQRMNSRFLGQTLDWIDKGENTTSLYPDCTTGTSNFNAAAVQGQ